MVLVSWCGYITDFFQSRKLPNPNRLKQWLLLHNWKAFASWPPALFDKNIPSPNRKFPSTAYTLSQKSGCRRKPKFLMIKKKGVLTQRLPKFPLLRVTYRLRSERAGENVRNWIDVNEGGCGFLLGAGVDENVFSSDIIVLISKNLS